MKTITIDGIEYTLTQTEKPSGKRWRAKENEKDRTYYKIDSELAIISHYECHLKMNDKHYNSGNYYKTSEEAERARNKQLALVRVTDKLREIEAAEGWVIDWKNSAQEKFIFMYSHTGGMIELDYTCNTELPVCGLSSSRSAIDYVIKHMQDDLKLIFGVE